MSPSDIYWIPLLSGKIAKKFLGNGQKFKKVKTRGKGNFFYLCQNSFKYEFSTPHIVKFDSGLVLFSSFLISAKFYDKNNFCALLQFSKQGDFSIPIDRSKIFENI